ncbi:pentatricopeptide repeat-containing protein At4g21880, mitochondrial isoform X2 [Physcomitrium patens]|nr:pentatricopeptide repeat-containing protein At5g16640, mitochondrial-like isoform X2 [Physcomitrium patens]|eukprot:XP_024391603.1 pentatricopeptide repeat-containing protein At5g16640, mitochondrial-like isoform X2 [Physcomitrella patens]
MRGKDILPNKLTYKPIMSWLAAKGNVGQFQELRKLMEDDGVPFDGVFKYYEIQLFLQSRDFERAKSLYLAAKKLDQKLPSSLDSRFLTALAKEDNISVVVDLLPKVIPTIKSSASVVTAMQCLGRHFQRDAALQAFSLLKTKGTSDQQMTFYLNAYIQGFSQAGKLADAINAFRELEIVSQVKGGQHLFNILIDFCCKQGKISQGLDFLDEMQVRNLELSSFSFNPFIREFGRWTMIDEAFEMKAAMLRLGVQPTVVTYNSLISACVKIGDLERACSLFPEMKELGVEANTHCYNPLIQGFAMQGRFDRALAVMRSMDAAGVKPDVNTYRLLIFACSLSKDQDKADQLFAEMQEREIRPDESIYTVMIIVYSKCGNVDRGIEMIRSLEKSGETAGIEAKSAILHGLAVTGRLEEALALYAVFKRERLLPHSYAVGTLLAALGKVGDLDKMFELFEDARGDGKWPFMNLRQRAEHLNIRCINSVLACIRHNQLGRAISFLRKVKEEGIADEGVLFDKIFLHISTGGQDENEMRWLDVNDGFLVINAMRELGLRPSRMSLEALLDGCAALNDSQQAHRVLQEMEREGLQLNIFSMIRVFRAYVAGEDEEKALDLLNQMPEEDLKDSDVRLLLVQILQPHYVAAADSPIAAEALETLPRVREKVDELLGGNMIPDTDIVL